MFDSSLSRWRCSCLDLFSSVARAVWVSWSFSSSVFLSRESYGERRERGGGGGEGQERWEESERMKRERRVGEEGGQWETAVKKVYTFTVFSPSKIQGMRGGHDLGGACSHIKALGFSPFPHQKKVCTEGLLGRHALSMLGRTLVLYLVSVKNVELLHLVLCFFLVKVITRCIKTSLRM